MKNYEKLNSTPRYNLCKCLSMSPSQCHEKQWYEHAGALYPLISFSFTSELMAKGGVLCIAFAAVHFKGNSFLT